MTQYHIQWKEQNRDGTITDEGLTTKAKDTDEVVKIVYEIANPVEIIKVEILP